MIRPINYLILVRHSVVQPNPNQPAAQWGLSDAGRQRCIPLAERLVPYRPSIVITSVEPKAEETGRLIAQRLNVPVQTAANLHEHERRNVVWFDSEADFEAQVARFFAQPDELVFGEETAEQAYHRFQQAIDDVVIQHPDQNMVIVAHGTVLSLLIGRVAGLDPYPFWKQLGMPAYIVTSLPAYNVVEVVNEL
jgi:broad specificity phosphatase PhoE